MTQMRIWILAILSLGLWACGPRGAKLGGGSQGAAQAMAQASSALTRAPSDTSVDFLNLGLNVKVKGQKGGAATLTYKTLVNLTGGTATGQEITIKYDNYTEDGKTF